MGREVDVGWGTSLVAGSAGQDGERREKGGGGDIAKHVELRGINEEKQTK